MVRYLPARQYLSFGITAFCLALFSGWLGFNWPPAFIPCILFVLTAGALIALAYQPVIEIHPHHLALGSRVIHWMDIRRVDRTRWVSPLLAVRLTLFDDSRIFVLYPGKPESCRSLLRQLRRASRDALIDGVPYRQYWGEVLTGPDAQGNVAPRFRLLRPEDEAEVNRLYQRLKTVGHLDPKKTDE